MTDTKSRILDAAERVFAEHGFAGASLRAITAEAGVNLAAVNYHFVSKEALMRAVFIRRLKPMNGDRLALLEECEKTAHGLPAPLEPLVKAFVMPLLRLGRDSGIEGTSLAKLLGRMFAEPAAPVRQMCAEQNQTTAVRFVAAFKRSLPHLPPEEIFWRLFLSIGIVMHVLASAQMVETVSSGLCNAQDKEAIDQRVVNYIMAGLQAPWRPKSRRRAWKNTRLEKHSLSQKRTGGIIARTPS